MTDRLMMIEETRRLMESQILKGMKDGTLRKTVDISTGLKGISLDAPALTLVPLVAPIRASIPRVQTVGSAVSTWKAIDAVGMPRISSDEATQGNLNTMTVSEVSRTYRMSRLGGKVTREAEAQSRGFDPALARETSIVLANFMKLDEIMLIGGNRTAYAAATGGTVTEVEAKGSIGAVSVFFKVAALTLHAMNQIAFTRPADADTDGDCLMAGENITGLNIATGHGIGQLSAEFTATFTGANNAARLRWTPIADAPGYAVFVGTTTGDANLKLNCIVTQANVTLTSIGTTGSAASTLVASSADTLCYDGMLSLLTDSSSAIKKNLAAKLTGTSSTGEITEFGDMFMALYNQAKIGKYRILVGGQEARSLTAKGAAANSLSIQSTPVDTGRVDVTIGQHAGRIINPVTGDVCELVTAPWIPGGCAIFIPAEIPYADAGLTSAFDFAYQYDVERWDYGTAAADGPIWRFDIMQYGVLRDRFPGGCGLMYNIWKG